MDASTIPEPATAAEPDFCVLAQKVDFHVDFILAALEGQTEITIQPVQAAMTDIRLHCRYADIGSVTVAGRKAEFSIVDPFVRSAPTPSLTVRQHHLLRCQAVPTGFSDSDGCQSSPFGPAPQLVIHLPPSVAVTALDPATVAADVPLNADSPFHPLVVAIEYRISNCLEGFTFVGIDSSDRRYPHAYTQTSPFPGLASALVPCIDDVNTRYPWTISVRCPRTVADVFTPPTRPFLRRPPMSDELTDRARPKRPDQPTPAARIQAASHILAGLSREEKEMDIEVIGSGDLTDEIVDVADPARKTVSFRSDVPVCARHIGFAVGPFEHVDLSAYRQSEQDDRLGDSAVRVHGYCLPRRGDDLRNTCVAVPMSVDYFTQKYGTYPFQSYKVCFVDDLAGPTASTASLSICSSRLLFPDDIVDTIDESTIELVEAVATQWIGVKIVPRTAYDYWITIGAVYWMALAFMATIWGRNECRFRQKQMADRVYESDVGRSSIYDIGPFLAASEADLEFVHEKAELVLFILNNRIIKAMGRNGVERILWRILSNAATGYESDAAISTQTFSKICEKVGHLKLDTFFTQWVFGAGCPKFWVTQRFNKKKLMVELTFRQDTRQTPTGPLDQPGFIREFRQAERGRAGVGSPTPSLFTGPMTIRIHEADGTPYEHIVDINEGTTKVEIPYSTKYKRLRRTRPAKDRSGLEMNVDGNDDVLVCSLGDVLQTDDDVADWRLVEWSKEDETRMNEESYEWVRVDKDFEWICDISFGQPHYMFVSQLQQDLDVVAQTESLHYLASQQPFPLLSSILVRTLMDNRYFYAVRALAADALAKCAREEIEWIGMFHLQKAFNAMFCLPGLDMPGPNDFSNRTTYLVQTVMVQALPKIRDDKGRCPAVVRQFLIEKLRYNDNSDNMVSDCYYISVLLRALTDALVTTASPEDGHLAAPLSELDQAEHASSLQALLSELDRYKRMDEWMSSFQNVFTITALDCLKQLAKHGLIQRRGAEFLQYARPSNSDEVRIKAFDCLAELGLLTVPPVLAHLFAAIKTDRSLYTRRRLWAVFESGIAAIGLAGTDPVLALPVLPTDKPVSASPEVAPDDDAKPEPVLRPALATALLRLRNAIGRNDTLESGLVDLIQSGQLSLSQHMAVLDMCALLYESEDRFMVKIRFRRYWQCRSLGDGKLVFSRTGPFRTRLPPEPVAVAAPSIRLTSVTMPAVTGPRDGSVGGKISVPSKPASAPAPVGAVTSSTSTSKPTAVVKLISLKPPPSSSSSSPPWAVAASVSEPTPTAGALRLGSATTTKVADPPSTPVPTPATVPSSVPSSIPPLSSAVTPVVLTATTPVPVLSSEAKVPVAKPVCIPVSKPTPKSISKPTIKPIPKTLIKSAPKSASKPANVVLPAKEEHAVVDKPRDRPEKMERPTSSKLGRTTIKLSRQPETAKPTKLSKRASLPASFAARALSPSATPPLSSGSATVPASTSTPASTSVQAPASARRAVNKQIGRPSLSLPQPTSSPVSTGPSSRLVSPANANGSSHIPSPKPNRLVVVLKFRRLGSALRRFPEGESIPNLRRKQSSGLAGSEMSGTSKQSSSSHGSNALSQRNPNTAVPPKQSISGLLSVSSVPSIHPRRSQGHGGLSKSNGKLSKMSGRPDRESMDGSAIRSRPHSSASPSPANTPSNRSRTSSVVAGSSLASSSREQQSPTPGSVKSSNGKPSNGSSVQIKSGIKRLNGAPPPLSRLGGTKVKSSKPAGGSGQTPTSSTGPSPVCSSSLSSPSLPKPTQGAAAPVSTSTPSSHKRKSSDAPSSLSNRPRKIVKLKIRI